MKVKYLVNCLIISILIGCANENRYINQLKTTDTLLYAIYNKDVIRINDLSGIDHEELGEDSLHFNSKVSNASILLQKHGIPDQSKYIIKEYPEGSMDLIDIIIPVQGSIKDSIIGRIIVKFAKHLPSNKLAYFIVDGPIKIEETVTPSQR